MHQRDHVRVAVIGTGFGGLGAAVRLCRMGITDFVLLERADSVGGTWRDNTYPGCAWPGTTGEFRRATQAVDLSEYHVKRAEASVPEGAVV